MLSCVSSVLLLVCQSTAVQPPQMTIEQVVARMLQLDEARRADLQNYVSVRHYSVENKRFHKHADMTVRVTYAAPRGKSYEVIAETGSGFVCGKIRSVLDAEVEASKEENGNRSRITPENYNFELLGTENVSGRPSYVIKITPRSSNKFLVVGKIWVDAEDFAIVRLQGNPAKNPLFWTTDVHVKYEYEKHGPFWLPRSNFSESKIRIAGLTELRVEYVEYELKTVQAAGGVNNEPD